MLVMEATWTFQINLLKLGFPVQGLNFFVRYTIYTFGGLDVIIRVACYCMKTLILKHWIIYLSNTQSIIESINDFR